MIVVLGKTGALASEASYLFSVIGVYLLPTNIKRLITTYEV